MTKDWLVSALQFWNLIWWLHLTRKLNPWMKITGSLMVLAPVFTFYQDQVSSSTCNCYLLLFGFVEFIFSFVSAHGIKFLSGRLFFFFFSSFLILRVIDQSKKEWKEKTSYHLLAWGPFKTWIRIYLPILIISRVGLAVAAGRRALNHNQLDYILIEINKLWNRRRKKNPSFSFQNTCITMHVYICNGKLLILWFYIIVEPIIIIFLFIKWLLSNLLCLSYFHFLHCGSNNMELINW